MIVPRCVLAQLACAWLVGCAHDAAPPPPAATTLAAPPAAPAIRRIAPLAAGQQLPVRVSGNIGFHRVHDVIVTRKGELLACFTRPEGSGLCSIRVDWRIGWNGAVVDAHVTESAMNDESLERCVAEAISRWDYSPVARGANAVVSYPFVFPCPAPSGR